MLHKCKQSYYAPLPQFLGLVTPEVGLEVKMGVQVLMELCPVEFPMGMGKLGREGRKARPGSHFMQREQLPPNPVGELWSVNCPLSASRLEARQLGFRSLALSVTG